jgi:hypothetical protein
MNEKPVALRLADDLTTKADAMKSLMEAAQILRIQHARNMDLLADNERLTADNERLKAENERLREAIEAYIRAKNSDGGEIGGFFPKPPTMAHQRRVYLAWQELNAALRREDV